MRLPLNIRNVALFFTILFSGFYLTRVLSLSPVYITFLIGTLVIVGYAIFNYHSIYISKASVLYFAYIIYIIVTQSFLDPNFSTLINVIFSLLYFIIMLNIAYYSKTEILVRYSKYFIWFTILLLVVEAAWRLTHPIFVIEGTDKDYRNMEGMLFYAFKFSSIMFKDSNFVGTYGLVAFFYYYYLRKKKYVKSMMPLIILFILISLTLSRSAIITVLLTIVILYFLSIKIKLHHIILGIVLIISVVFIALPQIETDGSFLSKFDILELTWRHLQECSLGQFLFGVGFGNTVEHIGIGAHNLLVTHLIESGIIGLLFFLIVNFSLINKTKRYSLYLTIPLFISGMSLAGHAISYYYACLALIYVIERNERKDISTNTNLQCREVCRKSTAKYNATNIC
jgi:wzy